MMRIICFDFMGADDITRAGRVWARSFVKSHDREGVSGQLQNLWDREVMKNHPGSAELGGPGGPRPPHLFGIHLVKIPKISKFSRIFFSLFSRAPHKKFASAHPASYIGKSYLFY